MSNIEIATKGTKNIVLFSFPFWTVVFFILLALKLGEFGVVATWSWWTVTAPLWAPPLIAFGLLGIFIFMMLGLFLGIAAIASLANKSR